MLLLNSRESLATAATMAIQILVVGALVSAGGQYLQWSSETNLAEFMSALPDEGVSFAAEYDVNMQVRCDLKRSYDGAAASAGVRNGARTLPVAMSPGSSTSSASIVEDFSH
ncbi:hypothetical protein H8A97_20455 [Bradyrhizobium sp. Arg62]|uniref:hypothetical protein n=1 Tax=Bradyrhizobium brasilense TaxID=1419277 RepID=UPI001E38630B|nr:hypothetical protein [Bradyrhizobium brasilense]MCC8947424.1 hypothetical protein [Bradyrhizobium brasilense]